VASQRSYLLLWLYAPEFDCFVSASGSQILAVWRECDGVYITTMPSQSRNYFLLLNIP
jgi:hypothetical protein